MTKKPGNTELDFPSIPFPDPPMQKLLHPAIFVAYIGRLFDSWPRQGFPPKSPQHRGAQPLSPSITEGPSSCQSLLEPFQGHTPL